MTRSAAATAAANSSPRARSAPWWTCTRSVGVNRAASRCQLPTSDIGQTSRVGPASGPASLGEQGEQLHRLAQPHVVGEHAAEPERLQEGQPGQAALLVRPQRAVEAGRRGRPGASRRSACPDSRSPSGPSAVDRHHRQRVRSSGRRPARAGAGRPTVSSPAERSSSQAGGEPLRVQLDPLPAQPHQRGLQLGQGGQLVGGQRLVAEGQLPAVVDERVQAEPAVGGATVPGRGPAAGRAAGRRAAPTACRHQPGSCTPNPAAASTGAPVAQEPVRAVGVERRAPPGAAVRSASSRSG